MTARRHHGSALLCESNVITGPPTRYMPGKWVTDARGARLCGGRAVVRPVRASAAGHEHIPEGRSPHTLCNVANFTIYAGRTDGTGQSYCCVVKNTYRGLELPGALLATARTRVSAAPGSAGRSRCTA